MTSCPTPTANICPSGEKEWVLAAGKLTLLSQKGAIQSDALTLRIFVIGLVGSDLRARRFCRTWPNRPPNRRFYG